jgi:hypothetical protein
MATQAANAYSNSISQLEDSWGKDRSSWSLDDWMRAALALEKVLSITGSLATSATDIASHAVDLINSTKAPYKRRRGRPKKKINGGLDAYKAKQPITQRHNNFKTTKKFPDDFRFLLIAKVEATKLAAERTGKPITDKAALLEIVKKNYPNNRKAEKDVRQRLAPMLSKSRTILSGITGYEFNLKMLVNHLMGK